MGLIFKIRRNGGGNSPRCRVRLPLAMFAGGSAGRLLRVYCPVFVRRSCGGLRQAGQSHQIVCPGHKVAPSLRPLQPAIPAPSQSAHRLDPPKDFLHPFPDPLARLIAALGDGASIQSCYVGVVLAGDVRRDVPFTAAVHKIIPVVALVCSNGFGAHPLVQFLMRVQLPQGHHGFGFGNGIMHREVGTETIPILHQHVPAEAQARLFALGFAIQHALGVGAALVRVVAAFLPAKIDGGIAGVFVLGGFHLRRIRAVLADKAFQAGPRFNQRAVGGEVVVARPPFLPRKVIDFGEEKLRHVGGENPLIVLGKNAVIEAAFAVFTVKEPEPEQIVAELLAEEPFAADAVKGGEHAGFEELLGRNAVAAFVGVEFIEERGKLFENGVHMALDRPQRMIGGHGSVEVDDGQKVRLSLCFSTHAIQDAHAITVLQ